MIHFSLFSGIGGFDLAADWMGWNNYLSCEINEFGNKILEYHFPNAYHHKDITTLNYETINAELSNRFGHEWRNDDIILTGGFPCQPFSLAGKRKGTNDERYLWGEMLRVISEIKPKFVIAENVFGITNIDGGMVFEQVCLDLENEGYEVQPFIIPAAAKNAPHRRDRVWFIAYSTSDGYDAKSTSTNNCIGENNQQSGPQRKRTFEGFGNERNVTNSNGIGCGRRSEQSKSNQSKERKVCENKQQHRHGVRCEIEGCSGNATNTNSRRQPSQEHRQEESGWAAKKSMPRDWKNFPTQSPIRQRDDGLPTELDGITFSKWRNESIKAYGNAIVPQVAFEIFKCISIIQNNL